MLHRQFKIPAAAFWCAIAAVFCAVPGHGGANLLRAHIVGMRSSDGKVHCTLFNSEAFPDDDSKAVKDLVVPIKDQSAECDFEGLAPGEYAIVIFHDENGNGDFDKNFLGIPKEGYAFSNNVKPKISKPTFGQSKFDYKGGEQTVTIEMIYW